MFDDGSQPSVVLVSLPGGGRQSLAPLLEDGGFETRDVETATACLDVLSDDAADCVVTGDTLPDATAVELVRSVRESHPSVPVVLVAEDGSEELASEAVAAGASGYVPAETSPETTLDRIRTCVEERTTESERRYENLIRTSPAPINLFDEDGRIVWGNDAVLDLLGVSERRELVGRSVFEFVHPDDRSLAESELAKVIERGESVGPSHMRLVRSDGDVRHVQIATAGGWYRGDSIGQAVVVDVTPLRRHEDRLARLNEMVAECLELESARAVCESVVDAAEGDLSLPVTAIARLDDEDNGLHLAAATERAGTTLDTDALLSEGGVAWETFVSGEATAVAPDGVADPTVDRLHVRPLGRHGVLLVGTADDDEFVELLASNVLAMLDRVERESLLREREERLETQNEMLGRLNRINDVIRSIDRALIDTTTRAGIERAVCEKLTDTDLFTFAWVGEYDAASERVVPRASAGTGQGYLDDVAFTADDSSTGQGPTGRAVRTREPQVTDDVLTDPPFEPWREAALRRGYRSSVALPLVYRESLYGVLNVYADEPETFGELEREVLTELGDTIAHAINAIESKRALVSDSVVEVELRVDPPDESFVALVQGAEGRELDLEGVVPTDDGTYRVVATVRNVTPAELEALTKQSVTVESSRLIAERDDASLVEATVTDESLIFWLIDHGARPQSLTVGGDGSHLRVELPGDADVREFVDLFREAYPDSDLLARRERERPLRTRQTFLAELEERLTPRQREVLETAYVGGYFETPRRQTGGDVAESLGISQPTFSDHLRASLRNLLGLLFEEGRE
ncbi:MAG: bacterio-opsin activator domain-containing protein [Haloferacaceae archaeon]